MRLNPGWSDRIGLLLIADFDEIPHTEECSRQQHEDQPVTI
jgi:hypothetical protein